VFSDGLRCLIETEPGWMVCGEVRHAAAAFEFVARERVDLALVDLQLRGAHGLELIQCLRLRFPSLRLLAMSQHEERDFGAPVMRAGADGFVSKQETRDVFGQAIRRVLEGRMFYSAELRTQWFAPRWRGGRRQPPVGLGVLSDRERQVLDLISQGLETPAIARQLHLASHTVETYRTRLKHKLGCVTSTQLVLVAADWAAGRHEISFGRFRVSASERTR